MGKDIKEEDRPQPEAFPKGTHTRKTAEETKKRRKGQKATFEEMFPDEPKEKPKERARRRGRYVKEK